MSRHTQRKDIHTVVAVGAALAGELVSLTFLAASGLVTDGTYLGALAEA